MRILCCFPNIQKVCTFTHFACAFFIEITPMDFKSSLKVVTNEKGEAV
jgi:hypothetical protein